MRKKVSRYFLQAFAMPTAKPAIDCFHFTFHETTPFISEGRSPRLKTLLALYPYSTGIELWFLDVHDFLGSNYVSIEPFAK